MWPQAKLAVRVVRAQVQTKLGLDITDDLPSLDADLQALAPATYKARYSWWRAKLAGELGDTEGEELWMNRAHDALSRLSGGCPIDLLHLINR